MSDPLEELRDVARAALPPLEGEIRIAGLREPVEVRRDSWGIPYISASSLDDLWFAQGYVVASDRLFQLELVLRASTGRLAEWFADLAIPSDRFARTLGLARIGAREAARWNERSRSMVSRFVEGARAWVASMPAPPIEYAILAVAPELPDDLETWAAPFAYVAWGLSGNWDRELLRVRLAERLGAQAAARLLPPAATPAASAGPLTGALLDALPRTRGQGSNNWAVAGSRTATGRPVLANDPHLLAQQPAAWYELHLRAPGYEARGVAFPFAPGIVVGTTAHHAWGVTNVSGDVQDLYVERLNEAGTAVELDGAWEPLSTRTETIAVRGGQPVEVEVRETRHGPLLDTVPAGLAGAEFEPLDGTYALRWTATDGLLEPSALVDAATAQSFEAFREALRGLSCPGQNVVYADVDGTIGYQCTGLYPIRRNGDGTVPVPGWTSQHEWDGFVPFEELPWSKDPASGVIVTANNRIHDGDYPHTLGHDFHPPYRAARIAELLTSTDRVTIEGSARIQTDTVSIPARLLLSSLTAFVPDAEGARAAVDRLRSWDGDVRADSWEAAVFEVWLGEIAAAVLARAGDGDMLAAYYTSREAFMCSALPEILEREPPATRDELLGSSLRSALDELTRRLGDEPAVWRWGALHRVRFAHPMSRLPGLSAMFVAAEHELGGDEQTVLQGGVDGRGRFDALVVPSWRMVVDVGDPDASVAVLTTGQSGNPASPHWNDQSGMWAAGEVRACPFSRPSVEAAAERVLTLVPR